MDIDDIEALEDLMILRLLKRNGSRSSNKELFKSREKFGFYNTGVDILVTKNPELVFKSVRMNLDQFKTLLLLVQFALTKHSERKSSNAEQRLFITLL